VEIRTFTGGGFGENAYLAVCERTKASVAIDPGAGASRMARAIEAEGLDLRAVLLTHAHLDHVEGVQEIRAIAPTVDIWLHPADLGMYRGVQRQAAAFGLTLEPQPEPTHELAHGQRFVFGSCGFEVRHTPGHAQGHVVLIAEEERIAIVGDVVFQGSIGRTDLPGGDFQTLVRSIREQVLTLPDDTALYPGHGPPTTVGDERVGNPFLIPQFRGEMA
jgi:glyoxylase-like metal-dependent hydrolase (beta-lactamase superfamily II)